jgi:hypothetical protein
MTKLPRERRAVVYQGYQWNPETRTVDDVWAAWHECEPGRYRHWNEILRTWHNAFWAADHHVRYDCGRRMKVSSGSYTIGSYTVTGDCMPPDPVDKPLMKGGMQGDPHLSDMGNPPGAESADDPWEGFPLEGRRIGRVSGQGYARGGVVGDEWQAGWASGGCA